ncbi:MAG: hypothetical protein ACLUZU_12180 [Faecalibacillus intestinalis]|uniref:hypothetical protein n=1 Tax=Faecalibacillus intestinalis TaxID=1982626 RepID=UPI00399A342A
MLLRYLIISIEDLKGQIVAYKKQVIKDQIVAYKEQVIKGQTYTDDLLNDISKDFEYIRANVNHKDMYNTCIELIKTIHNTLLDYINKAGRLDKSTTQRLISITNKIGFTRGDINAINDKVTDTAVIVNRIDDNTTPKTKIKAKNSSKKSE